DADLPARLSVAADLHGHPCAEIGVEGPKIEDILPWRSILGTITGVECLCRSGRERDDDLNRHRRLLMRITDQEVDRLHLLGGKIEDIVLQAQDAYGTQPKLSYSDNNGDIRFCYNLINLDFVGGVGYKVSDEKRIGAIKKIIERQRGNSFILIITLNVRDKI